MQIRTDLALEAAEVVSAARLQSEDNKAVKEGVRVENLKSDVADVTVVEILTEEAQRKLGKRIGRYVTVEVREKDINTYALQKKLAKEVACYLDGFLASFELKKGPVLVIGLGNRYVTPDSLGTSVVEKVLATHHVKKDGAVSGRLFADMGDVCTFSAGVLGVTGIESADVIKGLAKLTAACGIIVIDALAAKRTSRINRAFQITDSGIVPGSGVGNRRFEISSATLGIPVIAVGVPTVVDAATLATDVISRAKLVNMDTEAIKSALASASYDNMIVSPKNIDASISRLARVLADAINMTLHKGVDVNEINEFFI